MMDNLKQDLDKLNKKIQSLEKQINQEEINAKNNIKPLAEELEQLKKDKRQFASKNDFESVRACSSRERNLKFKINSQWNKSSMLKNDLAILKKQKLELENKIQLERDRTRKNQDTIAQMDIVLKNYKKTQNLKDAAVMSKIHPDHVQQWYDWGKNEFNETSTYFYQKIMEIDSYFEELKSRELKKQMASVADAYEKTNSLKQASEIAHVRYDTVCYWIEWGSRGFGEENTYFFKKIDKIDKSKSNPIH